MLRIFFLSLGLIALLGSKSDAQRRELEYKEYDDLLLLYMDENYEKIIKKCEGGGLSSGYIEKERKQPLPYIYLAKAYYEMSSMEQYQEEYSRAFKQALKYAGRFMDRDEKRKFVDDHERFLSNLREESLEQAKVLYEKAAFEQRNYRKARYFYKKLVDLSPNDPSPHYMIGLTEIKQGIGRQAERSFEEGYQKYKKLDSIGDLPEEMQELFRFFLEEYSKHLMEEGMQDSAKATIEMGTPYFKDNEDFNKQYQKVVK